MHAFSVNCCSRWTGFFTKALEVNQKSDKSKQNLKQDGYRTRAGDRGTRRDSLSIDIRRYDGDKIDI